MKILTNPLVTALMGAGLAAAVTIPATPVPVMNSECQTYRVRQKAVTAYVLKPPPAEVIYKACPQVTQKCEAPKVEEPTAEPVKEAPRRHHRRHRRVRAYWR